jgi:hypothetical protein
MAKFTRSGSLSALAEGQPAFSSGTGRFTIGVTGRHGTTYHVHLTAAEARDFADWTRTALSYNRVPRKATLHRAPGRERAAIPRRLGSPLSRSNPRWLCSTPCKFACAPRSALLFARRDRKKIPVSRRPEFGEGIQERPPAPRRNLGRRPAIADPVRKIVARSCQ